MRVKLIMCVVFPNYELVKLSTLYLAETHRKEDLMYQIEAKRMINIFAPFYSLHFSLALFPCTKLRLREC